MTIVEIFLLLGGIALFLYGMRLMSDGLKSAAGSSLRSILEHATNKRLLGILTGVGITALIQSSSATIVMTIGFVSASMMTLIQAAGVIMGANIGTTVTAQIVAFDLGSYAPIILFVGMIMVLFLRKKKVQNVGMIILGFGMLFMGLTVMKEAIAPLKESAAFIDFLARVNRPILAVLVGLVFTAIVQSSSSSVGIVQAFAIQGLLDYHLALYLVIGTSIGACMPAIMAMFASNREGKRAALFDLEFNVFRTILCFLVVTLIPAFPTWIQSISPNDIGRQIANTHTLLAILAVLVEAPFSTLMVRLTYRLLPIREDEKQGTEQKLIYIQPTLNVPAAIALSQAKREVLRMGELAKRNLELSLDAFFCRDRTKAARVLQTEETLNYLNHAITSSLVSFRTSTNLSEEDLGELGMMLLVITDLERIGDHAENIAEYTETILEEKAWFSDTAFQELNNLSYATIRSIAIALEIYEGNRYDLLEEAEQWEDKVDSLQEQCIANHIARLMKEECNPRGGLVFTDMVTDLERCSDHANNIAKAICGHADT